MTPTTRRHLLRGHHLQVRGVAVHLHWSLVLIVGIAVFNVTSLLGDVAGSLPMAVLLAGVTTCGMLASILWHELAHAHRGTRHGVAVHGVHLFVFGGVTVMDDAIETPGDEFRIGAVGPWRSLQLAALFGLVTAGLDWFSWAPRMAAVTGQIGWFNLALGVFNLVPAAPLDGGRILKAVVWATTGSRRLGTRGAAVTGVALGLAMWGLAAWLVTASLQLPVGAANRWSGVWAGAWLTVIAAFVGVLAVTSWRRAGDTRAAPQPDAVPQSDAAPQRDHGFTDDGGETSATSTAASTAARSPSRRQVWLRRTGATAGALLVATGALVVPMPWIVHSPGPVLDVGSTIEVSGATTALHGEALMLTVQLNHAGMVPVAWAAVTDARRIEPREAVIPDDVGDREWFASQREVFTSSVDIAAAAGLQAAGEQVATTSAVVVRGVLDDAPADRLLRAGDIITAVDDDPVASVDQLSRATATRSDGDRLAVTIDRDGVTSTVEVPIGLLPGNHRSGLGITIGEVLTDLELPREVASEVTGIGGPSAGLIEALVVYDLVSDEDLLAGRTIAATGTMDAHGRVGRIGGVPEKVHGALAAGAQVLVVPESQVGDAVQVAAGRLQVVGAATLQDAINAVRLR